MKLKRYALRCAKCTKYLGYADTITNPIVYCDEKCKKRGNVKIPPRSNFELVDVSLSCGSKGAFAELLAAAILLGRGYDVFRSVSPNAKCDLVIVRGKLILRIEVRSGFCNGSSLSYPKKEQDKADFYAVYHLRDGKPHIAFIRNKKPRNGKVNFAKFLTPADLVKSGSSQFL